MNIQVKYTYEDLSTAPDDGNRYEIFEGDLVMTPAPSVEHQMVVVNLIKLISIYTDALDLGRLLPSPVDVYLDDDTTVQPDLLFISKARLNIIQKTRIDAVPDWIAEVISESTESRDRTFKFKRYAQEGVKEYWIVDPSKKTVEVYVPGETGFVLAGKFGGKDEIRSPYFTGLGFSADQVFE